jgi:hypothetical protein
MRFDDQWSGWYMKWWNTMIEEWQSVEHVIDCGGVQCSGMLSGRQYRVAQNITALMQVVDTGLFERTLL